MSSVYRAICMSHDPAIEITNPEFQSGQDGSIVLPAKIKEGAFKEHKNCDLLMGRYSYPLIEVGCPGQPHCKYHFEPVWIDADWLRLLGTAFIANLDVPNNLLRCWTISRLSRLGPLL